jgi:hypothetical protein
MTYRKEIESASAQKMPVGLLDLYGIAKDVFHECGRGEAFLKGERSTWGPDPWERFEMEKATSRRKGLPNSELYP